MALGAAGRGLLLTISVLTATQGLAALPALGALAPVEPLSPQSNSRQSLAERLVSVRQKVMKLEQGLLESLKHQNEARQNIVRIKTLMELQKQEREIGRKRMSELESTIRELEQRRNVLRERIAKQQGAIRKSLIEMHWSMKEEPRTLHLPEREVIEAPRRKVLANLVDRGLKEIEAYRADLADADRLEARIEEEQQQLAYLLQDLKEQESVLELNRQLQADLLKKRYVGRLGQLENYRKLKNAEAQVERLIGDFNARIELERTMETERQASRAMMQGEFAKLKGRLPLPVLGQVVSSFGRTFDSKANLHVFKKGIEIATAKGEAVKAVSAGKIAYAGELPNYGRIAIVDHGGHFYSLCGNLGSLEKRAGDSVAPGDPIGRADDLGTPVYFEIRARNIAVNPLQWVSN